VRRLVLLLLVIATPAIALKKRAPKKPAVKKVAAKLKTPLKGAAPAPRNDVERLGHAYNLFVDGDFAGARKDLDVIDLAKLHNRDYALYLLGQAELLSGEPGNARMHFQTVASTAGRFRELARWRMADCDYALGKKADAAKAYEALLPTAGDLVEPAVARARIAEAQEERGAKDAAIVSWRKVYVGEPLHPLAADALERLKALGAGEIAPGDRISRARLMTANRAWPKALEELELLPKELPQATRDEADYWFGMTKFKMRRDYDLAAQKLLAIWQRLPGDDRKADALFHGARAQSRADLDDQAIEGYRQVVAKFPHSRSASEAQFLIGWLDFNRGHYKEAIPGLEETIKRYGSSQWEDDARWYLGFSRWMSGDTTGALADFDKLAAHSGALSGGKGSYWMARALDKLGRKDDALKAWRALVNTYPFSYYATQSRVRLKERGVEVGPFGDGLKGGPPPFREVDNGLATDPLIERVDELLAAGLTVEAGVELKRGEGDFIKRYGVERALPVLFDRYTRGDDFHRPHQLAETWSGAALRMDPQADATVRKWWEQVYPRAYRAFVEKYAPTGDNPPYYLYTIMQKESAYNPHDVSYADAIGLLQMIPPTSRRVALRIDRPYTDDVLYDPEGNIQFGAWYIGHLLGKFGKQIPLGAGSYNAGPKAMMKWVKQNGTRPLDEFIELCSYTQTREYMKKVVDIYARYVYLYEKEDWLPAATVDAAVLDDGIDY
jgi:soluble lytic murein transglycosylase